MFQISATGSRPLSPAKLTRLPLRLLVIPLALLAGCAHQLKPDSAALATPVPATALAATIAASPEALPADKSLADANLTPNEANAHSTAATDEGTTASLDSAGLPGPPIDSVVTVKQADLLERLRGGFALDGGDEGGGAGQP